MNPQAGAEPPRSSGSDASESVPVASPTGRTAWARNLAAPVRDFLNTETGGAAVLLCAAIAALLWANSPWSSSYESFWTTKLSIQFGGGGISEDLRQWVNEGLMTFFFLVDRARGQARARHGAAARAAAHHDPAGRGRRRHGAADPDLPGVQRRRLGGERLGSRDVDRHRLRARRARARGSRRHSTAGPAAHARGRRRPRGAGRDRHRRTRNISRSFRSRSRSVSSACCSRCGTRRSPGAGRPP